MSLGFPENPTDFLFVSRMETSISCWYPTLWLHGLCKKRSEVGKKHQTTFEFQMGWFSDGLVTNFDGASNNHHKSKIKRLESNNHITNHQKIIGGPKPDHSTCGFKITKNTQILSERIWEEGFLLLGTLGKIETLTWWFKAWPFKNPLVKGQQQPLSPGHLTTPTPAEFARKVVTFIQNPTKKKDKVGSIHIPYRKLG